MRAILQRVRKASVTVNNEVVGKIEQGLVVLLGVAKGDTEKDVDFLADKIINLRIFADEAGKFNRSLLDIGGEALIVSQFTLLADTRKGRRPSFIDAALPEEAERLFELFVERIRTIGVGVATGRFQQKMLVEIHNDGPVTISLDSRDKIPSLCATNCNCN